METTEPKGEEKKKKSPDVWKAVLSSVRANYQMPQKYTIVGSMHANDHVVLPHCPVLCEYCHNDYALNLVRLTLS
jgi:hypothetical protein